MKQKKKLEQGSTKKTIQHKDTLKHKKRVRKVLDQVKLSRRFFNGDDYLPDDETANTIFFITPRNVGKSTWAMEKMKRDWEQKKKKFVWYRRSETMLKEYLDDETKKEWLPYILKGRVLRDPKTNEIVGKFIALSTSHNRSSNTFKGYSNMVFDEFIKRAGEEYLKKEERILIDVIKSVERNNVGAMIYCLGNSTTTDCPYFDFFGVPEYHGIFYIGSKKKIKFVFVNDDFDQNQGDDTLSGTWAEFDPEMRDYMFKGNFSMDDSRLVKTPKQAGNITWLENYILQDRYFNFGRGDDGNWYIHEEKRYDPQKSYFVLAREDAFNNGKIMIIASGKQKFKPLQYCLYNGTLFFLSHSAKQYWIDYFLLLYGNIQK